MGPMRFLFSTFFMLQFEHEKDLYQSTKSLKRELFFISELPETPRLQSS